MTTYPYEDRFAVNPLTEVGVRFRDECERLPPNGIEVARLRKPELGSSLVPVPLQREGPAPEDPRSFYLDASRCGRQIVDRAR